MTALPISAMRFRRMHCMALARDAHPAEINTYVAIARQWQSLILRALRARHNQE